jgi:hypothetical protein
LQAYYGDAGLPENAERINRFFRHEFVHLLQKAWLPRHPWAMDSPLRTALAEIWAEGLGNYHSLSARWLSTDGKRSKAAASALGLGSALREVRVADSLCASRRDSQGLSQTHAQ